MLLPEGYSWLSGTDGSGDCYIGNVRNVKLLTAQDPQNLQQLSVKAADLV